MKSTDFIILLWWIILIILLCLGLYHLAQDAEKAANRKAPFNDSRELIIESCWNSVFVYIKEREVPQDY